MKNIKIFLVVFLIAKSVQSQNSLEVGVSASVVRFSDDNAAFIGDKYIFQVPMLNVAYKFNSKFSLNAELAFNTIDDIGIMSNSVKYTSYGGALRYHFYDSSKLNTYALIGGTMVQSEFKNTPTLNFGIGNSYWLSDRLGINAQAIYKFSEDRFESMRPHFQFTLGLVYSFDIDALFRAKTICNQNGF
ncbi:outer membrane beta-barrel protein [uncultured Polaribacter sp.]|uniref:outer membrane beta-barrel protein n=1 Tax=uncultured Polaribacter sp. TaxID=174711 RepID=UPI00260CC653|nr:outer membrane beta-barrel protein [uncultured Polaribacter sp.]